jgi:hypothetical protein
MDGVMGFSVDRDPRHLKKSARDREDREKEETS